MAQKIAAVIATLQEVGSSPESILYMFFDMNLSLWTMVRNALIEDGIITLKSGLVTLTCKGQVLATELNAVIR